MKSIQDEILVLAEVQRQLSKQVVETVSGYRDKIQGKAQAEVKKDAELLASSLKAAQQTLRKLRTDMHTGA